MREKTLLQQIIDTIVSGYNPDNDYKEFIVYINKGQWEQVKHPVLTGESIQDIHYSVDEMSGITTQGIKVRFLQDNTLGNFEVCKLVKIS